MFWNPHRESSSDQQWSSHTHSHLSVSLRVPTWLWVMTLVFLPVCVLPPTCAHTHPICDHRWSPSPSSQVCLFCLFSCLHQVVISVFVCVCKHVSVVFSMYVLVLDVSITCNFLQKNNVSHEKRTYIFYCFLFEIYHFYVFF